MANADEKSAGAQEPALARLAAHYGIEPEFRDARGKEIVTSPETQKRLLAAMGTDTEFEASAAGDAVRVADVQSRLPPVVVVRPERRCLIEVMLPHDVGFDCLADRTGGRHRAERQMRTECARSRELANAAVGHGRRFVSEPRTLGRNLARRHLEFATRDRLAMD